MHELIYQLKNETQILNQIINLSFETSLNTFLGVNKLQTQQLQIDTYKVIASSVESISKKLKSEIQLIIDEVNHLSMLDMDQIPQFEKMKLISKIYSQLESLEKHNHKIWLASSQFKVQNSQQETENSISSIANDIEKLNQRLELEIKRIQKTVMEIDKIINSKAA